MARYLLPVLIVFSGAVLALGETLSRAAGLTVSILNWCSSLMSACISAFPAVAAVMLWSASTLLASGLAYAAVRAVFTVLRGRRALAAMPLVPGPGPVVLIRDRAVRCAFTYGLLNPRIYVSTGLIESLTRDELTSVILHEAHHRRSRDPLKLLLASMVADAFFYLPVGRWLAGVHRNHKEAAADDSVVMRTSDPLTLAGAIVKVAGSGGLSAVPSPVSFRGSGEVKGRVLRLVEGRHWGSGRPGRTVLAVSLLVGLFMAAAVTLPLATSAAAGAKCDTTHCETHPHAMNDSCAAHCDAMGGGHV